jgi:hypothetical protein
MVVLIPVVGSLRQEDLKFKANLALHSSKTLPQKKKKIIGLNEKGRQK